MDGAQCDSGNLQPGGEELRGAVLDQRSVQRIRRPQPRRRAAGHRQLQSKSGGLGHSHRPRIRPCRIYRRLRTLLGLVDHQRCWLQSMHRPGQRPTAHLLAGHGDPRYLDDWGGWYDHVHPPPLPAAAPAIASSYAYGFRVPLLVVPPILPPERSTATPRDLTSAPFSNSSRKFSI